MKTIRLVGALFMECVQRIAAPLALAMTTLVGCDEFVPVNYTETVETGGNIEATYLKMGQYETASYLVQTEEQDMGAYVVYYPTSLSAPQAKQLPAVIFANGTGVTASKYPALFQHLASWGFIVVGNEAPSSGNGDSSDRSIAFLIEQSKNPKSPVYQKVDKKNIGISGHSQGGSAVFNAVADARYGRYYKTCVALSPANEKTAADMKWGYNPSLTDIPTLMIAGTKGDFETKIVIPLDSMKQIYDKLSGPKVMARRRDGEHGHMLYCADGYVTAWFMWQLKNDPNAAKAFVGSRAEIKTNRLYQDVRDNLAEYIQHQP